MKQEQAIALALVRWIAAQPEGERAKYLGEVPEELRPYWAGAAKAANLKLPDQERKK